MSRAPNRTARDMRRHPRDGVELLVGWGAGFVVFIFCAGMVFGPFLRACQGDASPHQDPATCEYFAENHPDIDPASILCEETP